jgi:hypothetical protein
MTNTYYVYRHIRPDTGLVFYVGKGQGKRHLKYQGRNKHWRNIVNKCGRISEIIETYEDENLALAAEIEIIAEYRQLGLNLVNYTIGGEGVSGLKMSDASKAKMRKARLGVIPWNVGMKDEYTHTEDTRKKVSEAVTLWWAERKLNKEIKIV